MLSKLLNVLAAVVGTFLAITGLLAMTLLLKAVWCGPILEELFHVHWCA